MDDIKPHFFKREVRVFLLSGLMRVLIQEGIHGLSR